MNKILEKTYISYSSIEHKGYCEYVKTDNSFLHYTPSTKHPNFDFLKSYSDEETFVKNYGNPLFRVSINRFKVVIETTEDKVSIKLFNYYKIRVEGRVYFVKKTNLIFLTYNIKTNSLYDGRLINYHLKRKCVKRIRRSILAKDPLQEIQDNIKLNLLNYTRGDSEYLYSDYEATQESIDIINKFIECIPGIEKYSDIPKYRLYKRYFDYGGVKIPDNWKTFLRLYPQPRKKELKKVNFKYIDCVMSNFNLNGDKIKRILHKIEYFNHITLLWSFRVFGKEYIMSKPDDEIIRILETKYSLHTQVSVDVEFKKSERENAYKIFKYILNGEMDVNTFEDHLTYRKRLHSVNPVKWKSSNLDEFSNEHMDWSEKYSELTSTKYKRNYNEPFKKTLELPLSVEDVIYYPILLTMTSEYNKESITQNNCVRTYIDKPESIIISLRESGNESLEKLTIEYNITKYSDNDTLFLNRVQTKYKSNLNPNEKWYNVLEKLDLRIKELCQLNMFTLPNADIILPGNKVINSNVILVKSDTNDYVRFEWDNNFLNKTYSFNYNNELENLPF